MHTLGVYSLLCPIDAKMISSVNVHDTQVRLTEPIRKHSIDAYVLPKT